MEEQKREGHCRGMRAEGRGVSGRENAQETMSRKFDMQKSQPPNF